MKGIGTAERGLPCLPCLACLALCPQSALAALPARHGSGGARQPTCLLACLHPHPTHPSTPPPRVQALAAELWGAEQSWLLVNGTTVGIHAAVLATCGEGSTLLLARNAHLSAFNAMVLAGGRRHRHRQAALCAPPGQVASAEECRERVAWRLELSTPCLPCNGGLLPPTKAAPHAPSQRGRRPCAAAAAPTFPLNPCLVQAAGPCMCSRSWTPPALMWHTTSRRRRCEPRWRLRRRRGGGWERCWWSRPPTLGLPATLQAGGASRGSAGTLAHACCSSLQQLCMLGGQPPGCRRSARACSWGGGACRARCCCPRSASRQTLPLPRRPRLLQAWRRCATCTASR